MLGQGQDNKRNEWNHSLVKLTLINYSFMYGKMPSKPH